MPSLTRLPALRSTDDLLVFLRDDLGWPLPEDALIDELTFDWTGEDLRLPDMAAQRLAGGSVRQLRDMANGQPWGVFLVEFASSHLYRTALRGVLRGLVPSRRQNPSLAAWRHENLLFICATANYANVSFAHFRGEVAGRARLATFGWEQGRHFARTLLDINLPALTWPRLPADAAGWLAQWSAAFDVEPVTQEFFRVYRTVFQQVENAVTGLDADRERRRLWTQRLFNRLMFIAFIEKKGWLKLNGRTDYLAALWDAWRRDPGESGLSFYAARLKWLFFQALNNRAHRDLAGNNGPDSLMRRNLGEVPYLNGGLFEQDADDRETAIGVPDAVVGTILSDLFARFNFTVTESTPLDVEVAVDPEMLGKVFEELVTGRHESGSYYTPKPIVAFMCREALRHHLARLCPSEDPAAVDAFIHDHDPAGLRDGEAILRALRTVRVCDPACGSGAYLLGMLHELLDLRACLFASRRLDAITNHGRKLEIIQHNLYGVDLDPFAVNIARLRLWLSLAVEYEGEEPPPLPNLDFKIESGDSLSAPNPHGAFAGQGAFRDDLVRQFQGTKAEYLLAHGDDKRRLRTEIDRQRGELAVWLHSQAPAGAFDWATEFAEIFAARAPHAGLDGDLNLGDTLAPAPEPGGFDIVVGNPPYVRIQSIKQDNPRLAERLKRQYRSAGKGNYDLYVVFVERSLQLLKTYGQLAFILPHKFFNAQYGEPLRELLSEGRCVRRVVHFGDQQVFAGATTYVCLLFLENTGVAECRWEKVENVTEWFSSYTAPGIELSAERFGKSEWNFVVGSSGGLFDKLQCLQIKLGNVADIFVGLQTSADKVFILADASDQTRDHVKVRDRGGCEWILERGILRRFLFDVSLSSYGEPTSVHWIIYPYTLMDGRARLINQERMAAEYPNAWAYLYTNCSILQRRERGRFDNDEWYQFGRSQSLLLMDSSKLVVQVLAQSARYAFDPHGLHFTGGGNGPYYGVRWLDPTELHSLHYLQALLNSRLLDFFLRRISTPFRGGYWSYGKRFIEQLPIRKIDFTSVTDRTAHELLVDLVSRTMLAKRTGDEASVRALEAEINAQVCRLYDLTPEEEAIVAAG